MFEQRALKGGGNAAWQRGCELCSGLALLALAGCARAGLGPPVAASTASPGAAPAGRPFFRDVAPEVGLDFQHDNGMSGHKYFLEMTGAGAALFDCDNDGDLDAYLVQGHPLDPARTRDAGWPRGRLFRNDLAPGASGPATLHFTDVTSASGLRADGYGMGVAAGDYDGDGWVDLYLTNWGANQLWRNRGDGRFEERTAAADVGDASWSSSASFVDFDRDGDLDLFVANYERWSVANDQACFASQSGVRDYCGPKVYPSQPDRFYRNRGDGSFEDATLAVGIRDDFGPGLGVVAADFDNDRWPDVYVANDGTENQLWHNQGGETFADIGMVSGSAVNRDGQPEASMGVAAADFDNDGDEDLFMTHLRREKNTLYENGGEATFMDKSYESGLAAPSLPLTAFGVGVLDYDNDGLEDLLVVNGAVTQVQAQADAGDPLPLREPKQLFRNLGALRFEDVTVGAGPDLARLAVGRGAAVGDVDNDGDADLLVTHNGGAAGLLLNEVGAERAWIGFRPVDRPGGRERSGARLRLELPDGRQLWRRAHADGSYASSGDPRVLFGLGDDPAWARVRVRWPDGREEDFAGLAARQYHELVRGAGQPVADP